AAGLTNYQFLIVGQGSSEKYLHENLRKRQFAGVLVGEELARAYANMDVFLFPSKTDTFGNVVLEALAAGTPALVTDQGGPQYIVRPEQTGFVCHNTREFVDHVIRLATHSDELAILRTNARRQAESASWDTVFQAVYRAYELALQPAARVGLGMKMPVNA